MYKTVYKHIFTAHIHDTKQQNQAVDCILDDKFTGRCFIDSCERDICFIENCDTLQFKINKKLKQFKRQNANKRISIFPLKNSWNYESLLLFSFKNIKPLLHNNEEKYDEENLDSFVIISTIVNGNMNNNNNPNIINIKVFKDYKDDIMKYIDLTDIKCLYYQYITDIKLKEGELNEVNKYEIIGYFNNIEYLVISRRNDDGKPITDLIDENKYHGNINSEETIKIYDVFIYLFII